MNLCSKRCFFSVFLIKYFQNLHCKFGGGSGGEGGEEGGAPALLAPAIDFPLPLPSIKHNPFMHVCI